jgi:hypothetical protein
MTNIDANTTQTNDNQKLPDPADPIIEVGPNPDLTQGAKFDANKPRPDLLAWDVVAHLPGVMRNASLSLGDAPIRVDVFDVVAILHDWFHGRVPVNAVFNAYARATLLTGILVADERAVETDDAEAMTLGLWETAKVLAFGAAKYAPRNWEKGILFSRVYAAALRHALAFNGGEDKDSETGISHLAHLACCCMFLAAFVNRNMIQFDDRAQATRP